MSDNTKLIKLVTTEILISKIEINPNSIDKVTLVSPYILIPAREGLSIANWIPFSNSDTVLISKSHILYMTDPVPDIESQYKATIGDIIVPKISSRFTKN
jgi:hypothetical protein